MVLVEEKIKEILNYSRYYSAGEMDYGIDGPELENGVVYISVYHYLQFTGRSPRDYDSFDMGLAFTSITNDYKKCKYARQNFEIGKYSFELFEERNELVEQYKR